MTHLKKSLRWQCPYVDKTNKENRPTMANRTIVLGLRGREREREVQ